jgi:hypothetical protein
MGDLGVVVFKKTIISELVIAVDGKDDSVLCRKGFKGSRIRGVKKDNNIQSSKVKRFKGSKFKVRNKRFKL